MQRLTGGPPPQGGTGRVPTPQPLGHHPGGPSPGMGCRLRAPLPPPLSSLGFPLLLFPFLPAFPSLTCLPSPTFPGGSPQAVVTAALPIPPYWVPTPPGPRGPLPSSQDPSSIPISYLVQPLLCCLSLLLTTVLSPALIPSCPHTSPFCLHRGPTAPCPLHSVFPPLLPPTTGKDTSRRESLRVHKAHPSRSLTSTSLRTSPPVMGSSRPSCARHPRLLGWAGVWCHPAPTCSGSAPGHPPVLSRSWGPHPVQLSLRAQEPWGAVSRLWQGQGRQPPGARCVLAATHLPLSPTLVCGSGLEPGLNLSALGSGPDTLPKGLGHLVPVPPAAGSPGLPGQYPL